MPRALFAMLVGCVLYGANTPAQEQLDAPFAHHFRNELARIEPLAGAKSAHDWSRERANNQRKLLEMLGLWPYPARTDLQARVTKVVERPDFVVENVLYQSMPGLYVTANLYRPKDVANPLPAIVYVCGHSRVEKDGVIYGNKTHYQHHAAWFAANGYVCLVLDTLQLGELPGLHHGMYREGRWWWQSRGYTPAGVEAWNAVRALDYLQTRPEVDSLRMGITGRSGGGATSWWVGAIDDRLAAVCPVAGITDLADHVVNAEPTGQHKRGVIEGHCDCMYINNTYRWDYDAVAALVAPKPLMIQNTDRDPIFPLAGVKRIHQQVARVYDWYGVPERLSLVIGSGGHEDSPELRHAAFAFFEKTLNGRDVAVAEIVEPDRRVPVELLKVLEPGESPADCRNATIDETFVARAAEPRVPPDAADWEAMRGRWMRSLREQVLRAWPNEAEAGPLNLQLVNDTTANGMRTRSYEFDSQPGVRLRFWVFTSADAEPKPLFLNVASPKSWVGGHRAFTEGFDPDSAESRIFQRLLEQHTLVLLAPRGVGPTAWPAERDTHLRRRFYLLGQTLDGMRAWDALRGLQAARAALPAIESPIRLTGADESAAAALIASLVSADVNFELPGPAQQAAAAWPPFLNFDRVLGAPQAFALLYPKPFTRESREQAVLAWPTQLGQNLGMPGWMYLP